MMFRKGAGAVELKGKTGPPGKLTKEETISKMLREAQMKEVKTIKAI